MKENRQLNNNDLNDVNGGYAGYNKYPKAVYHAAGFCTEYFCFGNDKFYLRLDGLISTSDSMCDNEASKYADYYLSHTNEEYIAFVQQSFPDYKKIYAGYDINM